LYLAVTVVTVVKVKPILNPAHGEVTAFTQEAVQILDQTLLDNRTVAITYVSVLIHRKFPQLPRESRRAIAARHLQGERKRREKNSKSK
jgi:hypothetical protein